MKKLLIPILTLLLASPAWAAQQNISTITTKASREALRTAVNTEFGKAHANFTEIYTALNGAPWLAQTTAPNIHNVFWIDTSGASPAIKYWDGDSWEVAASGGDGTYTMPTASVDTLGGVKVGARLSIDVDGVLSADVQSGGESVTVGDGTTGPYLDGTSDGGTLIKLYGPNTYWTALQAGAATANRSWRLPIAAAPGAGTTRLMNMDEYGQMGFVDPATFASALGTDDNYATDAEKVKLSNLSGTNSGDQTTITALATNPSDCSAGQYATTIAANGNLTCAQVSYSQVGSTPTLGTAAALDHGTAIGNLVRLTDDGGGNPALPFSLYLTNALLGSSTSLPGTCTVGQTYYDLDADTDGELYVCRAANTWKAVDDDGAAGITASSTDTFTNKTIDTAGTGNAITVPLNGVLDGAITDPVDADDMIYKKVQNAMTLTDIHCLAEGGGTITLTLQECTTAGASCANIENAITCDADGAEDDGTLADGSIAAGAWIKVLYSAPTGTVNNIAWTVYGTQTW